MCVLMYTGPGLRGMEVGREPVCTDVLCPFYERKEWRKSVHFKLPYSGHRLITGEGREPACTDLLWA